MPHLLVDHQDHCGVERGLHQFRSEALKDAQEAFLVLDLFKDFHQGYLLLVLGSFDDLLPRSQQGVRISEDGCQDFGNCADEEDRDAR